MTITKKKQGTLILGTSAILASTLLAGCDDNDNTQLNAVGVCVDKHTQKRLPDSDCDHEHHTSSIVPLWVYYNMSQSIPAVGSSAKGYSTIIPKGNYVQGGYDTKGGKSSDTSKLAGTAKVFNAAKAGSPGKAVGEIARGGFAAHGESGGGHGGGEGGHGG